MPRIGKSSQAAPAIIPATEIACFAYCPEQWRLEYGQGLEPTNRAALDAGDRHHTRKALAERIAEGCIALGRLLTILAILGLFVTWVLSL